MRPAFHATAQQKQQAFLLASYGLSTGQIAAVIGCSPPVCRREFAAEIKEGTRLAMQRKLTGFMNELTANTNTGSARTAFRSSGGPGLGGSGLRPPRPLLETY